MKCKRLYMALVAIAVIAAPLWSDLFRVGPGEPYEHIMDAIRVSSDGDIISVKSGTESDPLVYEEQIDFMGKDILVAAREVGATSPYQIDHPNPLATVIKLPDTLATSDEASVVYFRNGESQNAELRGFTITNGKGTEFTTWVLQFGNETNINMVRENTYVAGGVLIYNSSPFINHCNIVGNAIERQLHGSYIGGFGGGIFCDNASPKISHCNISQNTIYAENDKVSAGGGIYIINNSNPEIYSCEIKSNTCISESPGGAAGGGVLVGLKSSPKIYGCTISHNHATLLGGGLYFQETPQLAPSQCSPVLKRNYITYNSVDGNDMWNFGGGGIYVQDCNLKMGNNMLGRNSSDVLGGAITIRIYQDSSRITIINNTIFRNRATDAAGVCILTYMGLPRVAEVYFKNNAVVWNDFGGLHMIDSVDLYHDYNCYYGNVGYNYSGIENDPHMISADPYMDDDYHLTPISPLIDAGDNCAWSSFPAGDVDYNPNADIDGDDRFSDGTPEDSALRIRIDIGADEYPGPTMDCGDENLDGSINVADAVYLFQNLAPSSSICPYFLGDVNGDCTVNIIDAVHILTHLNPQPHDFHCPGEETCEPLPGTLGEGLAEVSFLKATKVKDNTYTIPVWLYNSKPVTGMQFEIKYRSSDWEIIDVKSTGRARYFDITEGSENDNFVFAQLCPFDAIFKGLAPGEGAIAKLKVVWRGSGSPDFSSFEFNKVIIANTQAKQMLVNTISGTSLDTETDKKTPTTLKISNVIPNPSSGKVSIEFSAPSDSKVTLHVYNSAGQKVRTLIDSQLKAGHYTTSWDGIDDNGRTLPRGTYLLILESGNLKSMRKITLVR